MTLSIETAAEIRRLYFGEHWKRGTIAAQLGVHHDAIIRVLGDVGPKATLIEGRCVDRSAKGSL